MIASAKTVLTLFLVTVVLLAPSVLPADPANSTRIVRPETAINQETAPRLITTDRATYQGYLRIYIVEPDSRYLDLLEKNYQFGFLGFAVNQAITVNDGQILSDTVIWNTGSLGLISQTNIKAIAVIFNSEGHPAYSQPANSTFPFTAHWADAAATSAPGVVGIDDHKEPYTHTVFLEEATASDCPGCTITREVLDNIYLAGNYQFLYAAMVTSNPTASSHLHGSYNIGYTPTVYFDGGHSVFVGGSSVQSDYTSKIDLASTRPVPPVKLAVKLNFLSTTQLSVEYIVKSSNQAPSIAQAPMGDSIARINTTKYFSTTAPDLDGDQVYYRWIFDKSDSSDWMGPYDSGDTCMISRSWAASGRYEISVLAKDLWDVSTAGSPSLSVKVYRCGDADGTGIITISDAVRLINYIFAGAQAPSPIQAGDADCNGSINISDAVRLINYIFAGGMVPCGNCP